MHFYTSPSYIIDYNVHYWGVVIKLAVFTHNGIKLIFTCSFIYKILQLYEKSVFYFICTYQTCLIFQ